MSGTDVKYAFSHILVAGSTLWCIYNTDRGGGGWKWIYGTYGSLCFYSFVGIWRYGNVKFKYLIKRQLNGEDMIIFTTWSVFIT